MTKKVFKVLGIIGLALLCLFCLMLSFFKPLNHLTVNASDSSIYYYYNCNVVSILDDDDNDPTINVNYVPSSFYGADTQFNNFGSKEVDLFYLDLYQGNNAFRIKFKLKSAYQDSVGLYAYNDSQEYFMCYYVRSGSSPSTYSPRFDLLNNLGGIITIPSNYTYSFINVSNEFNLIYTSVLRLNYLSIIDVSQFHNYILTGDYSEVDNRVVFETGYSQGYSQGQTDIINSPNEYDLYTQNQYEANYNTGFSAGADSDLTTNGFRVMMSTIFNAPYQILKPILNFELLGVNLWKLFTFVISITLVIIVVGAVKKR